MSKRYGRNKRRADRCKIASLELERTQLMKKIEYDRRLVESARQVCDVADSVNRYSVALPPLNIDEVPKPVVYSYTEGLRYSKVDLVSLEIELEKINGECHFVCRAKHPDLGNLSSTYHITENGLQYVGDTEIARILVRNLKHDLGMKR